MKNYNVLIWIALLVVGIVSANFIWKASVPGISGRGTIEFVDLEGGFFGVVSDDGQKYDPVSLDLEFQEDGLRVSFTVREKKDTVGIHMWGKSVEIIKIEKI